VEILLVVIIVVALLAITVPLIWLVTKGVPGAAQRATGEIDASGAQGSATDDDTGATGSP
jgi:hypothetical protein